MLGFTKHTQLTRFVKFLRRQHFCTANLFRIGKAALAVLPDFPPLLRGVVFLGQFRVGAVCEGLGLRAVSFDNYVISRFIGLRPAKLNASHKFRQCHKVPALFRRCGRMSQLSQMSQRV